MVFMLFNKKTGLDPTVNEYLAKELQVLKNFKMPGSKIIFGRQI